MNPLVSPAWLADRLKEPDLRILDAAWYMPGDPRTGSDDYAREHIPGAIHFDIDAVCDPSNPLPHMLPSAEVFAEAVGALGVSEGDRIVIYDHLGLFSAARVWWSFRAMGHDEVFVLDGGLTRWKAEGHAVTDAPATPVRRAFQARSRPTLVKDLEQVRQALEGEAQVLDARPADRFLGAAPEPRPGLRSGHMPGALNLPYGALVEDGRLKPPEQLEAALKAAGLDLDRPVVTTCGSGVSAAILALALARLGRWDAAVYDGSWTEWGGRSDTEVITGG
jgi:thiosulfate/3-mercaptopyruvate sulfurtransferase